MEVAFLRFVSSKPVTWLLRTRIISTLLFPLIYWTRVVEQLPDDPDSIRFIFLVSYAQTSRNELSWMSLNTSRLAGTLADYYKKAVVIGGEFRDNKTSGEWNHKLTYIPSDRAFCIGKVSSTTDEREAIVAKAVSLFPGVNLDNSIVVCNGAHARRLSVVWRHFHPHSKLYIVSTDPRADDDPENPMLAQRYWQTWLVANLVGEVAYRLLGVDRFARKNMSQPVE